MNNNILVLAKRLGLFTTLLIGLLSLEACKISTQTNQGATTRVDIDRPGKQEVAVASVAPRVETEPVLAVHQPALLESVSEKHFVIPVARSGDFAPDTLDDYVLRIIEESRQWAYVAELQIHGHTDSEGSELSNMLLSIRRANHVAERFEELGVEAGLLLIEAHGETQAIADNTTLDGRIANRRIEIVLIGNAGKVADEQDQYDAVVAELRAQGETP